MEIFYIDFFSACVARVKPGAWFDISFIPLFRGASLHPISNSEPIASNDNQDIEFLYEAVRSLSREQRALVCTRPPIPRKGYHEVIEKR